jgi:hypothetical protein
LDLLRSRDRRQKQEQGHVDLHAEAWFEANIEGNEGNKAR